MTIDDNWVDPETDDSAGWLHPAPGVLHAMLDERGVVPCCGKRWEQLAPGEGYTSGTPDCAGAAVAA